MRESFHHFVQKIKSGCKAVLSRMTLWLQLVLFMTLLTSLITFILIYKEYTSTRSQSIHNLTDTSEKLLNLEAENLENYLSDLAYFCVLPCYDFQLSRMIEQKTPFSEEQVRYLKEQMYYYYYTRADIEDYHIYLLNQNLSVGRSAGQQRISTAACDASELEDIFQLCVNSRYNHAIYPSESSSGFLTYYHTLIRVKDQIPQALVKIQVDRSYLRHLLPNHSEHGEILLLTDADFNLLFSGTEDLIGDNASLQDILSTRKTHADGYETVQLPDEEYLLISSEKAPGNIRLLSLTPLSYIDSQIGRIRSSLLLSGILIWLCAIVLINMFIRLLTNPLKLLSRQMERTGGGDFHTLVHAGGSQEILELSQSFNSMVVHIDELIRRTYLAELSEKNARLTALEAQLNPHFLYNTLQAISTEALLNDQPQINKMITSLASNLRYTIKGGDLVPLGREMEYVRDYIYLQKIRMDDKLSVEIEIEPDTTEYLIPKISIQTLVENSILHGISPQTGSIHIRITARRSDENLTICVRDNGNGISEEQLTTLYQNFEMQDKSGASGGIGLVNLYTRLKLLYEKPARLDIRTEYGSFTEILLTLPAIRDTDPLSAERRT